MQMRCDEASEQLELYVLDELSPETRQQLEAHLARCAGCRRAVAEYRWLISDIRSRAPRPTLRPDLVRSIQRETAAEVRSQTRRTRWRHVAVGASAVAAVLLAGVGLWRVGRLAVGRPQPAGDGGSSSSLRAAANMPEVWRHGGAQALTSSPADTVVIRGSSMYFLRRDATGAHVAAIDASTGELLWQSDPRSRGYIAADSSRVYCLSPAGRRRTDLVALDARDGSVLWRYADNGADSGLAICCAVAAARGRVCWTTRSTVHMVDAHTGQALWRRTIADEGPVSAALDVDGLYVASTTSMRRLDAETGRDLWSEALGGGRRGLKRPLLAVGGDRAFLVQPGGKSGARLICLDLASRQRLWDRPAGDVQHLLAAGVGVYLRGDGIRAYDSRTGGLLWSRAAGGCGPLTSEEGLIHFVDTRDGGRLLALDSGTGRKTWEIAGIRSCGAFRRVGGTGFIKTRDGVIHAIALRTR